MLEQSNCSFFVAPEIILTLTSHIPRGRRGNPHQMEQASLVLVMRTQADNKISTGKTFKVSQERQINDGERSKINRRSYAFALPQDSKHKPLDPIKYISKREEKQNLTFKLYPRTIKYVFRGDSENTRNISRYGRKPSQTTKSVSIQKLEVSPLWRIRDDKLWKVKGGPNGHRRIFSVGKTVEKGEYHKPNVHRMLVSKIEPQAYTDKSHRKIFTDNHHPTGKLDEPSREHIKTKMSMRRKFLNKHEDNMHKAVKSWDFSSASKKYTHWEAATISFNRIEELDWQNLYLVEKVLERSKRSTQNYLETMVLLNSPKSKLSRELGKKGVQVLKSRMGVIPFYADKRVSQKITQQGNQLSGVSRDSAGAFAPVAQRGLNEQLETSPATNFFLFLLRELDVPELTARSTYTGVLTFFNIFLTSCDEARKTFIILFLGSDLFLYLCRKLNEYKNVKTFGLEWAMKLFESIGGIVSGDSERGIVQQGKASTLLNRIKFSPLVVKTMYIFNHILGLAAFAETAQVEAFTASSAMKILDMASTETNTMIMFVELVEYWEERVESFKETLNWRDFFQLSVVDTLIDEMEKFSIRIQNMSSADRPEDYRVVNIEGHKLLTKTLHVKHMTVTTMAVKLRNELSSMVRRSRGPRTMPDGYIIGGVPGVGKTIMLHMLERHLKYRRGMPKEAQISHSYTQTKHQILPLIVKIVVINDMFQTKDEYEEGIKTLPLLQGLCDTEPFSFETASLEDKENSSVAPEMVMGSTNCKGFSLSTATSGANKLNRRFKSIWVTYSKETLKNNTIDYLKENPYVEGGMVYSVYRIRSPEGIEIVLEPKPDEIPIFVTTVVSQLVKWLVDTRDSNIVKENKSMDVCECGLMKTDRHSCLASAEMRLNHITSEASEANKAGVTYYDIHNPNLDPETDKGWRYYSSVFDEMAKKRGEEVNFGLEAEEEFPTEDITKQGNISVTHKVEHSQSDYMQRVMDTFILEYNMIKKGLTIGAVGIGAFSALLLLVRTIYNGYIYYFPLKTEKQGALVTKLREDLGMAEFVRPFMNSSAAWANRDAKNAVFGICSLANGYAMHGLLVTHKILAIPHHFMVRGEVVSGTVIEFSYNGIVRTMKFQPPFWYRPHKTADLGFLHIDGLPAISHPVYDALLTRPVSSTCKGSLYSNSLDKIEWNGRHYEYTANTQKGDCGLPLITSDGKVLGVHVGFYTHNKVRISEPITLELVQNAMATYKERGLISDLFSDIIPATVEIAVEGNPGMHPKSDANWYHNNIKDVQNSALIPLGWMSIKNKPKMTCRRSKIFDEFGVTEDTHGKPYTGKAKLLDGKWVSPITRFLDNADNVGNPPHNLAMYAMEQFIDDLPEAKLKPLSWTETITGHPDNCFINARDNDKSVGFTLGSNGVSKKLAFTKNADDTWEINDLVKTEMFRLETNLSDGRIGMSVAEANFKDEAYPVAKIAAHKARLFYVNDLAQNLLMRKYLLPILALLMEFPLNSGVVVAINAASFQWNQASNYLNSFGDLENKVAGDEVSLDLKQWKMLSYYAITMERAAKKFGYTQHGQDMVRRIILSASRFVLVLLGDVFVMDKILTSGRPDTIHANCVTSKLKIYMAVGLELIHTGKLDLDLDEVIASESWKEYLESRERFRNYIKCLFTGDDNTLAVKGNFRLTGKKIQEMAALCGHKMTKTDKTDQEIVYQFLGEISYLQRDFIKRDNQWYAPLSRKSIFKSLMYVTSVKLDVEDERNVNASLCACREWYLHGKAIFDTEMLVLKRIFPNVNYPTYDTLDNEYHHGIFQTWRADDTTLQTLVLEQPATMSREIEYEGRAATPERNISQVKAPYGCELKPCVQADDWWSVHINNAVADSLQLNTTEVSENTIIDTQVVQMGVNDLAVTDLSIVGKKPMRKEPDGIDLSSYFQRPRVLVSFSTSGGYQDTEVYSNWRLNNTVADVIQHWSLFRGDPVLTFAVTGGSQFMGLTRIVAVPNRNLTGTYGASAFDFKAQVSATTTTYTSQLPHVDIDLSLIGTYELKLPYPHPVPFMEDTDNDWTLVCIPVNNVKMANGNTPSSLNIVTWLHYENVTLSRITVQGKEAPQGQLSNLMEYASIMAAMVPYPIALPISQALGAGGQIAKFMGYSKPSISPQDVIVIKPNGNLAAASGEPRTGFNLALDSSVTTDISGGSIPLNKSDDTEFQSLIHRSAQIAHDWPSGVAIQMVPGAHQDNSQIVFLTPVGFVASMFKYWTGELRVCVQVISSPLIRWRIGVMIVPPGEPTPVAFDNEAQHLSTIVEVVGSTCAVIDIPYLYQQQFQVFSTPFNDQVNINETRIVWFPVMISTGPSVTPVIPIVNLWLEGGDDFSCGLPDLSYMNNYAITVQGGMKGKANGSQAIAQFGEVIGDLLLLTRRSVLYLMTRNPTTHTAIVPLVAFQPNNLLSATFIPGLDTEWRGWTYASYLGLPFMGAVGTLVHSVNYAVPSATFQVSQTKMKPGSVLDSYDAGTYYDVSSRGVALFNSVITPVGEIIVPNRNPVDFFHPIHWWKTGEYVECVLIHALGGITVGGEMRVYTSTGDDYMLGGFLAIPGLQVTPAIV